MSTPNFTKTNASLYYAVGTEEDTDFNLIKSDLQAELETQGFTPCEKWEKNGWRAYEGQIIAEKQEWNRAGTISYNLQAIIRNGYYAGATLDWAVNFEDCYGNLYDELNSEDLYKNIQGWHDKKWTWTRQAAAKAERAIRRKLDKAIEKLEKLYAKNSTPLIRTAIFSNGEAIYQKAKAFYQIK